jgi:hypothetical protein
VTRELEERLQALGAALELPAPPDLAAGVVARLPDRRRQRHTMWSVLAVALAVAVLFGSAAMAVPGTRDAILRVLGLRGVQIEFVVNLPPLGSAAVARLALGERIPLVRARRAASFTALLPSRGADSAFVGRDVPGGRVSVLVGRVLIIEFRGASIPFVMKFVRPGTTVRLVRVRGGPGVYLAGALHEVSFEPRPGVIDSDRVRLAGNVLVWQQGQVTVRIEGVHSLGQALAIAHSLR